MLTTTEIAKFLASINLETRAARHIRATVYRTHSGRWPTWHAHAMTRTHDAIVEVAELTRTRSGQRYAVIVWSLSRIRMVIHPRATLAEARAMAAHMLRIDAPRAALERGGLRPN
jgi:hypothetical protein